MNLRRYFRYFDYINLTCTLALLTLGLAFVYSATYTTTNPYSIFFKKQLFGAVTGMGLYFLFCTVDIRGVSRWGYYGYLITLGLLAYTIVGGWVGLGAKRWISLGIIRFQPSELAKVLFPFFVATHLEDKQIQRPRNEPLQTRDFYLPLIGLSAAFLLIFRQPDLGTALIVLFSGGLLLWTIGLPRIIYVTAISVTLLASPVLWHTLKPYQKQRVMTMLGHGSKNRERYQIEQSLIAVGSGGITGQGYLQGTQNKLLFLPEDHTDFIFAVVCEEWGFLGALLVIGLFCLLLGRLMLVVATSPTMFEHIVVTGLLLYLLLSFLINVGMVIGLLPTVGIPLPFMSYGVTHLWCALVSTGILNNAAIRRFYF